MHTASTRRGFTLIELLTVIAIIALLAAMIFPVASTVREQARASDCQTKLHQLWVAANVYKQDEGSYPDYLLGVAPQPTVVPVDHLLTGTLYGEQIKDVNVFKCPDNTNQSKTAVVVAHIPPKPNNWQANWLSGNGCSDANGPIVGTSNGNGGCTPSYFYVWDSYDIGPRVDANGRLAKDAQGNAVFDLHYSPDWTGKTGLSDLPNQLKYSNPPDDRTMLTYCTWHAAVAGTGTVTIINMGGTARKVTAESMIQFGPNQFNR